MAFTGNSATRRGHAMEPYLMGEYEIEVGYECILVPYALHMADAPWISTNLDGWDPSRECPVECKSSNWRKKREFEAMCDGDLAALAEANSSVGGYWVQAQHHMLVTGAQVCVFVVDVGEGEPMIFDVPRDEWFVGNLLEELTDFWHVNVLGGVAPAIVAPLESTTLREAYPDAGDIVAIEDIEVAQMVKQHGYYGEQKRAAEREQKLLGTQIEQAMLEAGGKVAIVGMAEGTCKLSYTKDGSKFDSKAMRKAHPELCAEFMRPKAGRFQIGGVK